MTLWLLLVYLVGVPVATRRLLRWWMLLEVCPTCREIELMWCSRRSHRELRPRGAISDRRTSDALGVGLLALLWPLGLLLLPFLTLRAVLRTLRFLVLHSAPLTEPELERRSGEREREIAELTTLIEAGGTPVVNNDAERRDDAEGDVEVWHSRSTGVAVVRTPRRRNPYPYNPYLRERDPFQ